jgi:hypothetical protein
MCMILIVRIGMFHGIKICYLLKKVKRSGKEVRINRRQHLLTPNDDVPQVQRNSNRSQIYGARQYLFLENWRNFQDAVRKRYHQHVRNRFLKARYQYVRFRFRSSGGEALSSQRRQTTSPGCHVNCSTGTRTMTQPKEDLLSAEYLEYCTPDYSTWYSESSEYLEVPEFLLNRVMEHRTPYRVGRLCQCIPKMSQLLNSVIHDEIQHQNVIHLWDFMYKSRTTIYDLI